MADKTTDRTADIRDTLWGDKRAAIEQGLEHLDPDLAELVFSVAYDTVLARPGLGLRTRELLAVTALLSVGSENELKTHMRGALNCGATIGELKEVVIQAAMFLGFPRALMGMRVLRELQDKLQDKSAEEALKDAPHVEPEQFGDDNAQHNTRREQ